MSWRNQGITGSNNIPLGNRRRFGDDDASASPGGDRDRDLKRGRDPEPRSQNDGPRQRKKRNRWGDASENKAAGLMGLPTAILSTMTSEQLEAYTLHLRIEEISQKLRIDDVVPADGDRSPSPAPQYDNHGRRVNTREYRYRKRLEDERHKLIEKAMKTIPNYHPPQDYRRPTKTQEKVYVPVNDYPEINFSMIANPPNPNHDCFLLLLCFLCVRCCFECPVFRIDQVVQPQPYAFRTLNVMRLIVRDGTSFHSSFFFPARKVPRASTLRRYSTLIPTRTTKEHPILTHSFSSIKLVYF